MRDMEGARKRAITWIVGCAFYSAAALIMSIAWGWSWAAAFIPLVCMLCAAACFELGRDYQYEIYCGEDEDWLKPEGPMVVDFGCKRCKGTQFRMIAGRLVCNICGEVMGVDHGEDEA